MLAAPFDLRATTGYQDFLSYSPVDLVYVADPNRMQDVPAHQRESFAYASAGAIVQNVYPYCASVGLAVGPWPDKLHGARGQFEAAGRIEPLARADGRTLRTGSLKPTNRRIGATMNDIIECTALREIRLDHKRLASVTAAVLDFVRMAGEGGPAPDPIVLRAMLYYIREYPGQFHHPMEDRFLFPALRSRTDDFDDVLDELQCEHIEGDGRLRNLEHALTSFELKGEAVLLGLRTLMEGGFKGEVQQRD